MYQWIVWVRKINTPKVIAANSFKWFQNSSRQYLYSFSTTWYCRPSWSQNYPHAYTHTLFIFLPHAHTQTYTHLNIGSLSIFDVAWEPLPVIKRELATTESSKLSRNLKTCPISEQLGRLPATTPRMVKKKKKIWWQDTILLITY